eukprot:208102_1
MSTIPTSTKYVQGGRSANALIGRSIEELKSIANGWGIQCARLDRWGLIRAIFKHPKHKQKVGGGRRTKGKSGKAAHGKRYFIKRGLVAAYKKLDAAKKDKAVAWLKDNALDVTNYVLRLGESVDEAKRLGLIYRFS